MICVKHKIMDSADSTVFSRYISGKLPIMFKPLLLFLLGAVCSIQTAHSQSCVDVCPQVGLNTSFEFLAGLSIGPLTNISGDNGGYADFSSSVSATFTAGTAYSYTIGVSYPQGPFSDDFKAWMDFNHDGDFEDPGELILDNFGTGQVSGTILVPSSAINGPTKLRVAIGFQSIELCEDVPEGEVEDYCVTVVGGQGSFCDSSQPVSNLQTYVSGPILTLGWDPVPFSVGCIIEGGPVTFFNTRRVIIGEELSFANFNLNALPDGEYNWSVRCSCTLEPSYDLTPDSDVAFFELPGFVGITDAGGQLDTYFSDLTLSPNPTTSELNLSITSSSLGKARLKISDILGRSVIEKDLDVVKGSNSLRIDVSTLSQGTYLVTAVDNSNRITTAKFIKK